LLGVPPADAAAAWQQVGQSFGIEDLRAAIGTVPAVGSFAGRAKAEPEEDQAIGLAGA